MVNKTIILATIFVGVLGGLFFMIQNFLSNLPRRLHDIKMENFRNENAKQLQIDSFYRQTSNKKLMNALSDWISLIYDLDEMKSMDEKSINNMLSKVVLHGSDKSIARMADYQQFTYKLNKGYFDQNYSQEEKGLIAMYLASFVITQLKENFTGYKIDYDDLLRAKISDYNTRDDDMFEKMYK